MRGLLGTVLALLATAALGATPAAAAPPPFLAVDCAQTVYAFRDQPVHLSRIAVSRLVTDAVRAESGGLRAAAVGVAFPLGPAVPVGAVPDGTAEIPGPAIADAVVRVVATMAEIAPAADEITAAVRSRVAGSCGMTVHALDRTEAAPAEPPSAPGASPSTPPAAQPAAQPAGGADAPAEVELYDPDRFADARDHGDVPVARAGLLLPAPEARHGAIPGYHPEFGLLGQDVPVDAPGDARALPIDRGEVALPVLLAVLCLSVVTGALVRAWVLRED